MVRARPRGDVGANGGPGPGQSRTYILVQILAYPCIPYRPLQTLTYYCISLHTLTYSYRSLQTVHILAYPCISLHTLTGFGVGARAFGGGQGGGWGARTILGRFESFRGVWRAKCQYDKIGLMGYCSATLGPIVQHLKCIVGRLMVPGPLGGPGREL